MKPITTQLSILPGNFTIVFELQRKEGRKEVYYTAAWSTRSELDAAAAVVAVREHPADQPRANAANYFIDIHHLSFKTRPAVPGRSCRSAGS
jgi:hypothetical protein